MQQPIRHRQSKAAKGSAMDGRIVTRAAPSAPSVPQFQYFFDAATPSHGPMAPSLRRKNLVCFYCNKKSGIKYDGLITKWECGYCDSMNFLDENGEITDPPVATDYAAPAKRQYAIPGPDSPPASQESDVTLFCQTCLKNQHLYTSSLAQYYVETDPAHPQYREMERKYFKYKEDLERRYPQVCEDCEPRVLERMRQAGKIAKSDYLRQLMQKSRSRRTKANSYSISFVDTGRLLWYAGLLGQFMWNGIALLAAAQLSPLPALKPYLQPTLLSLFGALISAATSSPWAWWSLCCTISSLWWNPKFKEANRGFMNHINGFANWYKFQGIMVVTRSLTYHIMGTGVLADPNSEATIAAHIVSLGFNAALAIMAQRSLKVDMTPLWTSTPEKLAYVGPRSMSSSPSQDMGGMSSALDQIGAAPSTKHRPLSPLSPSLWKPSPTLRERPTPSPSLSLSKTREVFPIARTTPSLLDMTESEAAHYLKTGQVPVHMQQRNDPDIQSEMDWSPSAPETQHRAFNPARARQVNAEPQPFGQTPVHDQPSPFWYKVPPAPITPAHRLRNPPNQPRLRVASQETKDNFFNSVTRRNLDVDSSAGETKLVENIKPRQHIEFAPPKFFPPSPPQEAGDDLADLFNSAFSLSSTENGRQKASVQGVRMRHLCQALVLLFGLLLWNYYHSHPSEHAKNVSLVVMVAALFIGGRTILDNTVFAEPTGQSTIVQALCTGLGSLEFMGALYGIVEIVYGRGDCSNCASLGNILVAGTLIHELWLASFGR
ncbi:uncharacterized protein BP5553_05220 [Venustampulla echinocandica]|uniref:Ima1 N-terminal domain-containing protein n=1 Tax=Venustampulla echinocandica TaxID=2656787 RepID=A0A370TQI4_9HELO|nr:uncharacterized protein BP5553_05220 [Venustampulla echinocandica]RDL37787.1 hypothetical protein BP5553_05220 [Venustampulla echinocandica]